MPSFDEAVTQIETALGHTFADRGLVRVALTHRSFASEHGAPRGVSPSLGADNERMEFLGDAVLGLAVADALWQRVPTAREGELSRLRAAVVNETSLAQAAASVGIGEALRLGRGEDRTGGRARPSILADALEAVLAAVYLDAGFDVARAVVQRLLSARVDEVVLRGVIDDKSALQELLQARHKITPRYELVAAYGPDHDREHEVELRAGEVVSARGRGRSKKEAEQAAARTALEMLASQAAALSSSSALPSAPAIVSPAETATEKPAEQGPVADDGVDR